MTHPEQFTARQWDRWVRKGRALVKAQTSTQFDLGDLTISMIPQERNGDSSSVEKALAVYADAIGVTAHRLLQYRRVAIAWPIDKRRPEVGFAVHEILTPMTPPSKRYRMLAHPVKDPISGERRWTVNQALRAVGRSPNHPVTQSERIDHVRDLVSDDEDAVLAVKDIFRRPAVVQAVLADPACHHIVRQAEYRRTITDPELDPSTGYWDRDEGASSIDAADYDGDIDVAYRQPVHGYAEAGTYQSMPRGYTPPPAPDPTPSETLEVLQICTSFYAQMQRIIPNLHVPQFNQGQRQAMLASLERVRAASEWAETVIKTGDTSMDEALAKLLGGSS